MTCSLHSVQQEQKENRALMDVQRTSENIRTRGPRSLWTPMAHSRTPNVPHDHVAYEHAHEHLIVMLPRGLSATRRTARLSDALRSVRESPIQRERRRTKKRDALRTKRDLTRMLTDMVLTDASTDMSTDDMLAMMDEMDSAGTQ